MKDTAAIGSISEAKILARFVELGWEVLIAWRRSRRYDMVIEREGRFYRIQCKTGKISHDGSVVSFRTYSKNGTTRIARNYVGEIDYFAVYCPDNNKVYLIPMAGELGLATCSLRLTPTQNKQEKNVRLASNYEL